MNEIWQKVVGCEGYAVSSFGRVMNIDRQYIRKATLIRGGYHSVRLCEKNYRISRLVLEAFKGPALGREAAHLNGVRTDDRLYNLEWKTKKANEADKVEHGTLLRGESCSWAQLTEAEVTEIRARSSDGESYAAIARSLGKKYQVVYDAATRRSWSHV
jgi:NUMOD4 motif-containing protein/HNH endonuclease